MYNPITVLKKFHSTGVTKSGHLTFGGIDVVKLVKEFGTPLYVMDEMLIRAVCRNYKKSFGERYPNVNVLFASKALSIKSILKIVQQEGLGIDVASSGELYGAMSVGFEPSLIFLHGNYKKDEELEFAVKNGVGRIVVDSLFEVEQLKKIGIKFKKKINVLLRITPGIEAHTHEFIQTGKLDTKFGIPIADENVVNIIRSIYISKNLNFKGLHYHLGSQILECEPFAFAIEKVISFIYSLYKKLNIVVEEFNIGGGFAIRYTSNQDVLDIDKVAETVVKTLEESLHKYGLPKPKLLVEPGRSIVGEAGITLYTIGPVKEIKGVRRYAAVDGGLSDNPRPALYGAKYDAVIANRINNIGKSHSYRICGRHCETDVLFDNIVLSEPQPGNILAVFSTGAYNYSMSSNYNKFTRPAVVLINSKKAELIVRREIVEDLFRNDVLPERFQ